MKMGVAAEYSHEGKLKEGGGATLHFGVSATPAGELDAASSFSGTSV